MAVVKSLRDVCCDDGVVVVASDGESEAELEEEMSVAQELG